MKPKAFLAMVALRQVDDDNSNYRNNLNMRHHCLTMRHIFQVSRWKKDERFLALS